MSPGPSDESSVTLYTVARYNPGSQLTPVSVMWSKCVSIENYPTAVHLQVPLQTEKVLEASGVAIITSFTKVKKDVQQPRFPL